MAGGSQDVRRFMDREATPPRGHGSARYPPEQERSPSPPPLPTKRRKYQRVGSGSSEEDVVPVDSPPKLPKKQPRKTKHVTKVDPDEEMPQEEDAVIVGVGFSQPPVLLKEGKDGKRIVEPATPGILNVRNPLSLPLVSSWEKGMDTMNVLMDRYRVDSGLHDAYKLMPEQTEIFQKMCQTWMNEEARALQLTFTTQKSFSTVMGRLLQGYIFSHSGIAHKNWECTGSALWDHGCTEVEGQLKCLHGMVMIHKDHVVEMDVTSENGQRALKEQPSKAKVTQNRWGRSVVQLTSHDARCCVQDAGCGNNQFSGKSCGLFFSEGAKAQQAFKQITAFVKALYPNMQRGAGMMLMPVHCECNHKPHSVPFLGRQLCKMTPFGLSNAEDLDKDQISDKSVLASVRYPSLMVFQCCNPVYRNSRAQSTGPNCDFKISAPDMLGALQMSRRMWSETFPEIPVPKLVIPEFKWQPKYQYRNVALPSAAHNDERENPFDF